MPSLAIQITNLGSCYSRLDDEFFFLGWNFDGQEVFKRAVKGVAQACHSVGWEQANPPDH